MEAFVVPGVKACIVELSPEHSGIIASIATTAASIPGILAPQLAGSLQDAYVSISLYVNFTIKYYYRLNIVYS